MMDFDAVRMFLRVVERGGFTSAAKHMRVPVSTISRKISILEDDLGVPLLHRSTRRVSVTQAGLEFYEKCLKAETALDEAEHIVRTQRDEPVGLLRVLMPYALGLNTIEPTLATFRRLYPLIKLELTFENLPLELIEHGFDVALRRGPLPDSGYLYRRLAMAGAKLVAAPHYLDRVGRPKTPEELSRYDLIAFGRAAPTVWRLRNESGQIVEVAFDPVLAANESMALAPLAVAGAGVALLSPQISRKYIEDGSLERVLPGWDREQQTEIVAIYPAQAALDRKVRLFVDHCIEVFSTWDEMGRVAELLD